MKREPREHIEAKIINLLRDTRTPCHASKIADHIQETRQDTLYIIQRLLKEGTIQGKQDLTHFNSTGEIVAYTLGGALPEPALIPALVPPSGPATQLRRGPAHGR